MLALLMLLQVLGPPADDQPAAAGCGRAADDEVVVCAEVDQAAFRLPKAEAPRRGLPAAAIRLSRNATATATAEAISGKEPGVAAMVNLKIEF